MSKEAQTEENDAIEPRFLTLDQVARYLSVSSSQAYALVRSGDLPAIKLGGRGVWRVDKNKMDAYLEDLEQKTAQWTQAHPLNPRDLDDGLDGGGA